MRVAALLVIVVLAGCVGFGPPPAESSTVPAGQLGPVIRPAADGAPIECRGIPRNRCEDVGTIDDGMGIDLAIVDRVIVSCLGICNARGGEFRLDVVVDGGTREIARGGWGE